MEELPKGGTALNAESTCQKTCALTMRACVSNKSNRFSTAAAAAAAAALIQQQQQQQQQQRLEEFL